MSDRAERPRVLRARLVLCRDCGAREYDTGDDGRCVACSSERVELSDRRVWWVRVGPTMWQHGVADPLAERRRTWGPYETEGAANEALTRMQGAA